MGGAQEEAEDPRTRRRPQVGVSLQRWRLLGSSLPLPLGRRGLRRWGGRCVEAEGSAVTQATERRAESQAADSSEGGGRAGAGGRSGDRPGARPAHGTGERGGSCREAPGT